MHDKIWFERTGSKLKPSEILSMWSRGKAPIWDGLAHDHQCAAARSYLLKAMRKPTKAEWKKAVALAKKHEWDD